MSKFSSYARKMNEIANATFTEYREKSDAVKSAESKYRAYPRRSGADPSYMAKSARAEADLAEARAQRQGRSLSIVAVICSRNGREMLPLFVRSWWRL